MARKSPLAGTHCGCEICSIDSGSDGTRGTPPLLAWAARRWVRGAQLRSSRYQDHRGGYAGYSRRPRVRARLARHRKKSLAGLSTARACTSATCAALASNGGPRGREAKSAAKRFQRRKSPRRHSAFCGQRKRQKAGALALQSSGVHAPFIIWRRLNWPGIFISAVFSTFAYVVVAVTPFAIGTISCPAEDKTCFSGADHPRHVSAIA